MRCFGVQQLQCSMVVNRKLAWGCLLSGWLCQIIQVNLSMGLPIRKLHGMDYVEGLAILILVWCWVSTCIVSAVSSRLPSSYVQ
jgi:hypothetical protein